MSSSARTRLNQMLRTLVALCMLAQVLFPVAVAQAVTVMGVAFSGGAGTVTVNGTLYAKSGSAVTLTVTTSSDTRCVKVSGAYESIQTSAGVKTSWVFPYAAPVGNGNITVNITASDSHNNNDKNPNCTGPAATTTATYILDNTGPVVSATLSPAPNAAGWNNSNVAITWSATDAGSGVANGPTPATDTVTGDTAGTEKTATATDRLGNAGAGAVTVKLDKTAPLITGTRSPAANSYGWNNTDVTVSFTCSDGLSGVQSCTGTATLSLEGASQSVTGTAVDYAGNAATAAVSGISIDKTAPTLTGAPIAAPNAGGWYTGDVTIRWTAADELAGIVSAPADTTITGEGTNLSSVTSVSDKAGNATTASSQPVSIDRTAPSTTVTAPGGWNNSDASIQLVASDSLSGVAATYYTINGGAEQVGTSLTLSEEGIHTLRYWSVDNAGNVEAAKSVTVKVDKTAPTISHTQDPEANANGWNNTDVTVTFTCADSLSGLASCTAPQTVVTEGQNQPVTGTATDNAGNTATDPVSVSIDKTPPEITGATDRAPNTNGWYNADVTVTYTCSDALSGLTSCQAAQTLGEGEGQTAEGMAIDAAGNSSTAVVTGISVDKTAPVLTGAPATAPNAHGWYRDDVTVRWTCSDALSGLAGSCPGDSTIAGEGHDLSASAAVSDLAGNGATATVSNIRIDRTAPSTFASVPAPLESGWYAGAVQVTLTTGPDLSGVDKTYYTVDGGAAQEYTDPFSHDLKGSHLIVFWSVDKAGNRGATGRLILRIDGVAPSITGVRLPIANMYGWNNSAVTISFACSDAESGIAGCSDPVTLYNEGEGQSVTGSAIDNAGNTASAVVSGINIDLTAPTVSGAATTSPNAIGWYNSDVTIRWTAQDGLSGINPATLPADSVITGEGASLGAGPVTVEDKAGNVGTGSVSGIKIDRTAPTITGTPSGTKVGTWYKTAVTVSFQCADALSGIAECAQPVVLDQDGTDQTATGSARDKAENVASTTVSGINIDTTPPISAHELLCQGKNGWCRNTATLTITATDALSGTKEIQYRTKNGNGAWGNWQSKSNRESIDINIPLNSVGRSEVEYRAVDNAGNVEAIKTAVIKYDNVSPVISKNLSVQPNAAGWHNQEVVVSFAAVDQLLANGSGVDAETMTITATGAAAIIGATAYDADTDTATRSATVSDNTASATLRVDVMDIAGNAASDSQALKLDKTAPTITGAALTQPNANGWYNGPVVVRFTCTDSLSGIASCPGDVTLTANGANQSHMGFAEDKAGNTASFTVTGINIDAVAPVINGLPANGQIYTLGAVPTLACSAEDAFSGVAAGCTVTVTGGTPNGVGTFTYTYTATDRAGNTATLSGTYRVIYRWDGFLQPINDTAHQTDTNVSVFKANSTVPAKFQLKNAQGTVVQANSLPQWLVPVKGSATTAPVDEGQYADPATSGSAFRWDATAQQYIYNWGTKGSTAGHYHRIGVRLDDGQTYYVNIGLR